MRILYLGNNWMGLKALEWLKAQGGQIVGLVAHPEKASRFRDEIVRASGLPASAIIDGSRLKRPSVLEAVAALKPDLGLSVFFGYIVRKPFLDLLPSGCINLHPAYLPYNRGKYPNVWSIVDRTPAGVSLHYMNEGVDTGDIIARRKVPIDAVDTGESLYHKLELAGLELLRSTWPDIVAGKARRIRQPRGQGSFHLASDVEGIDELKLDQKRKVRDVLDLLRARTFPPYSGAYFRDRGRKIQVRIQLIEEERPKGGASKDDRTS